MISMYSQALFTLSIFISSGFASTGNEKFKPCLPDGLPTLFVPGFCASTDELKELCGSFVSSLSTKDCSQFNGNWCCFVDERSPARSFLSVNNTRLDVNLSLENSKSYDDRYPQALLPSDMAAPSTSVKPNVISVITASPNNDFLTITSLPPSTLAEPNCTQIDKLDPSFNLQFQWRSWESRRLKRTACDGPVLREKIETWMNWAAAELRAPLCDISSQTCFFDQDFHNMFYHWLTFMLREVSNVNFRPKNNWSHKSCPPDKAFHNETVILYRWFLPQINRPSCEGYVDVSTMETVPEKVFHSQTEDWFHWMFQQVNSQTLTCLGQPMDPFPDQIFHKKLSDWFNWMLRYLNKAVKNGNIKNSHQQPSLQLYSSSNVLLKRTGRGRFKFLF